LTWRWQQARANWRSALRYTIVVLTPYVIVPTFTWATLIPGVGLWYLTGGRLPLEPVAVWKFVTVMALICATSAALWLSGHRYALSILKRRRTKLTAYLADPERG